MWFSVTLSLTFSICGEYFALWLKTHHWKQDGTFTSNNGIMPYYKLVASEIPEKCLQVHICRRSKNVYQL